MPVLSPTLCVGRHDSPRTVRRPWLCDPCRDRLYTRLVAIPDLARMCRQNLEGLHGQPLDGKVTGSKERPLPNGALLSLLGPASTGLSPRTHLADQDGITPIPHVLRAWVELISTDRQLTGPTSELKAVCSFLREHSEWAADQEWAGELDTEVRDCHSRLLNAAGLGTPRTRYKGAECPECAAVGSLIRWDGQDEIRCHTSLGGCGTTMSAYYTAAIHAQGGAA